MKKLLVFILAAILLSCNTNKKSAENEDEIVLTKEDSAYLDAYRGYKKSRCGTPLMEDDKLREHIERIDKYYKQHREE